MPGGSPLREHTDEAIVVHGPDEARIPVFGPRQLAAFLRHLPFLLGPTIDTLQLRIPFCRGCRYFARILGSASTPACAIIPSC